MADKSKDPAAETAPRKRRARRDANKLLVRRTEIFKRNVAGETQVQIARSLGMSKQLVYLDIIRARAEYREASRGSIADAIELELAKLDALELTADQNIELSQRGDLVETEGPDGKKTRKRQRVVGSAEWAKVKLNCQKRRAELLGLDAPKRSEIKADVTVGTFRPKEQLEADIAKRMEDFRRQLRTPPQN